MVYTNDKVTEREVKLTIPLIITSKRIKYLRITLPKRVKDLYWENYKMLIKETDNDTKKRKIHAYTLLLD